MAGVGNSLLSKTFAVLLPKGKGSPDGTALTPTYNPSAPNQVLTLPTYREHMTDIFQTRSSSDSKTLIQGLLQSDPDMSAALNAFLTVAATDPIFLVRNADRTLDEAGQSLLNNLLTTMTVRSDYSTGFQLVPTMEAICSDARYMLLMRGGVAGELLLSKEFFPTGIRSVDLGGIEWVEPKPGQYKPVQKTSDGKSISLDIPTFYTTWFRKDPTKIYASSPFVSAITTISARQQVINDLYRIMKVTGYPRLEGVIMEEVVMKNAPPDVRADPALAAQYVQSVVGQITGAINNLRPDSVFVHTDSIKMDVMNDKTSGVTLDIEPIIRTLNAQNQAGLKTMATILGRGESGVNTASVEARVFSLSAQALNEPIADYLSYLLTLAMRLNGSLSYVEVYFTPVEMRSDLELATQRLVKAQMLKEDLSLGLISDVEYHLQVHNRLPPPGTPVLSGTNFDTPKAGVDTTAISPNGDPVGRAATPESGNGGSRDNRSKTKTSAKTSK